MRPVHPGEVLREEIEERRLSANALSQAIGVPANRITGILNEARAVTPDTAMRLARCFGMSAAFWLNLQQAYDLRTAEAATGAEIERRVRPIDATQPGAAPRVKRLASRGKQAAGALLRVAAKKAMPPALAAKRTAKKAAKNAAAKSKSAGRGRIRRSSAKHASRTARATRA